MENMAVGGAVRVEASFSGTCSPPYCVMSPPSGVGSLGGTAVGRPRNATVQAPSWVSCRFPSRSTSPLVSRQRILSPPPGPCIPPVDEPLRALLQSMVADAARAEAKKAANEMRKELDEQAAAKAGLRKELDEQTAAIAAGLRKELREQTAAMAAVLRKEFDDRVNEIMVSRALLAELQDKRIAELQTSVEHVERVAVMKMGQPKDVPISAEVTKEFRKMSSVMAEELSAMETRLANTREELQTSIADLRDESRSRRGVPLWPILDSAVQTIHKFTGEVLQEHRNYDAELSTLRQRVGALEHSSPPAAGAGPEGCGGDPPAAWLAPLAKGAPHSGAGPAEFGDCHEDDTGGTPIPATTPHCSPGGQSLVRRRQRDEPLCPSTSR